VNASARTEKASKRKSLFDRSEAWTSSSLTDESSKKTRASPFGAAMALARLEA
jgi:hypothetical protein